MYKPTLEQGGSLKNHLPPYSTIHHSLVKVVATTTSMASMDVERVIMVVIPTLMLLRGMGRGGVQSVVKAGQTAHRHLRS